MAGKIKKALKVVAGSAAAAGVYWAGRELGKAEVMGEPPVPEPVATPRPGMKSMSDVALHSAKHSKPYHDCINERAADLRARIAEQVYQSAADAEARSMLSQGTGEVEVQDAKTGSSERPAQAGESTQPADESDEGELDPYKQIHDAISSSELFTEESDKAYKPTPFTMPGKQQ